MQLPIFIKFTSKCDRCGLRYPKKETACLHCSDLSDQEVEVLKDEYDDYHKGNKNLGQLFFYITGIILLLLVVVSLSVT